MKTAMPLGIAVLFCASGKSPTVMREITEHSPESRLLRNWSCWLPFATTPFSVLALAGIQPTGGQSDLHPPKLQTGSRRCHIGGKPDARPALPLELSYSRDG